MTRYDRGLVGVLTVVVAIAASTPTLAAPVAPVVPTSKNEALNPDAPIEADADHLDYDHTTGRILAVGHVVIRQGTDELRADRVLVSTESGDSYALGNVILKRGEDVVRGEKLHYNFKTRESRTEDITVDAAPFQILAGEVTRAGQGTYTLRDARVTTCQNRYPFCHYHVSAKRIVVHPGDYLKAYNGVWWFGRVPVMYMPYWYRNLNDDSGFRFRPGMDSRMGPFLLSSYRHRVSPWLQLEHHLDYRTKRGVAVGEDLRWTVADGYGDLMFYFASDDKPVDSDEDAATADISSDRYRIRLRHEQTHGPRTYSSLQATYLSDTDIEEDFFESDYRHSAQPENYYSLTHREDAYTINALARIRLNDFFENVNRLPEVTLDVMRQQLGDSSFYYDSQTAAGLLQRVWPDASGVSDYSTFRFDTEHVIYQPRRILGWLNVVPRAGYRGTYFATTRGTETSTTVVNGFVTNTVVSGGVTSTAVTASSTTNTATQTVEAGSAFRSIPSVGVEMSFKAYRILDATGAGLRHVVEPYLNYTYAMEPTVLPEELYQFDSVDALGEVHTTRLGVRNKLQTRRHGRPSDILDLDVSTILNLASLGDEQFIEKLYLDGEFDPVEWLSVRADGILDINDVIIDRFNSRLLIHNQNRWDASIEHRYIYDASSMLAASLTLRPSRAWEMNAFGRYEFEEGRVEEEGGYVQRNLDCVSIRLGGSMLPGYTRTDGTERDNEYRVMIEFWLSAFPEYSVRTRTRY